MKWSKRENTGKQITTRCLQHKKAVFNGNFNDSALSEHTKNCQAGINWDDLTTISTEPFYYQRTVREALEIQREEEQSTNKEIINQEAGQYVTTSTWRPLLKKIKN